MNKTKGRQLAELLRDILAESEAFGDGDVSEITLEHTAQIIQKDIDNGKLIPDENDMYYDIYFSDLNKKL